MTHKTGSGRWRRWSLALLASVSVAVLAGNAVANSLQETVRGALESNPEIDVVKTNRRAIDQELRQARAGYLPSLDFRGGTGPEWTDNTNTRSRTGGSDWQWRTETQLTLSQMLFDGFETQSEVARQKARIDSASYRVEEAAEFTALNAIEAHLDILRNQEIVRFNELNIAQHERILGQVRDLESAGRGDIADVLQTESRLARAFDTLAVSRGALADAIAGYQRVVGARPGELEDVEAPVAALPPSAEDAANLASVNSPTVQIAAADIDVAEAEYQGSRANFYPRFDVEVGGGLNRNIDGNDGRDNDFRGLVVMSYNLYRGGADIALEREAFHRENEARASLRNIRLLAEEEARVSYNALETARARTDALVAKAEAQRRTRDAYAQQFEVGQRELLDLLDAENELFLNRVELTTAVYTERFATYRVLAVVGELLNTLEMVPPREAVSVHRTVEALQTPEAIEEKALPVYEPRAEPRPVEGVERGEPPTDALDMAPLINDPPAAAPAAGAALPVEPAADMADVAAAAPIISALDEAESSAVELTSSEAPASAAPSSRTVVRPVRERSSSPGAGEQPAYDTVGEFFGALFGGSGRSE